MTEEQKQKLEAQLWKIANELRGKMGADEFRDYILGFIFYKYLSEKQYLFANRLLETEKVKDYALVTDKGDLDAIKEESLEKLGYLPELVNRRSGLMELVRRFHHNPCRRRDQVMGFEDAVRRGLGDEVLPQPSGRAFLPRECYVFVSSSFLL
jgi:hypothetical protein